MTSSPSAAPRGLRADGAVAPALMLTLCALSAFSPLAMDLYLPAFPGIGKELHVGAGAVQLTMTAFLAGAGLGQILFGPLSDKVGRRRPILLGILACLLASLLAALSPNLVVLFASRFVQGLASAAGMVVGRAMISDLVPGPRAARPFSVLMLVNGLVPVVAPLGGALLVEALGWRGLLLVVAGAALLLVPTVLVTVPETLADAAPAAGTQRQAPGCRRPRRHAPSLWSVGFAANAITFVFAFGALMAYISSSSFVYQDVIGVGARAYGLLFGLNALGLTTLSIVSTRAARRHVPPAIPAAAGLSLLVAGSLTLTLLVLLGAPTWTYAVALFVTVASVGLILGNATALALSHAVGVAGRGSAVLGAGQFGLAALVSAVVGLGGESTVLPLALSLVACALIAALGQLVARTSNKGSQ